MILYLSIWLVLLMFAACSIAGLFRKQSELALAMVLELFFYCVSFLRWDSGTDFEKYLHFYRYLDSWNQAFSQLWWGPGYSVLAVICNKLNLSFTVFLFTIASIILAAKYFLFSLSKKPLITLYVLFCLTFNDLFFVRQNVAGLFVALAVVAFSQRRRISALLNFGAAVAFHYGAIIVALTAYGVRILRSDRLLAKFSFFVVIVPIAGAAYYFMSSSLYAAYLAKGFSQGKAYADLRGLVKAAYWLLLLGFCVIITRRGQHFFDEKREEMTPLYVSLVVVAAAGAGTLVSQAFARLPVYIYPLLSISIANYYWRDSRQALTMSDFAHLLLLASLCINLVVVYFGYPDLYYPIHFVWDSHSSLE